MIGVYRAPCWLSDEQQWQDQGHTNYDIKIIAVISNITTTFFDDNLGLLDSFLGGVTHIQYEQQGSLRAPHRGAGSIMNNDSGLW